MLEKTDTKQGPRFRKGQSGNPSGRPRGARNKATLAVEALLGRSLSNLQRQVLHGTADIGRAKAESAKTIQIECIRTLFASTPFNPPHRHK